MSDMKDIVNALPSAQPELPFPQLPFGKYRGDLIAVDLFAGIGGLSAGFREHGFSVTGVDHDAVATSVYENAGYGTATTCDLSTDLFFRKAPIVMGGPPCRPWSAVNLQRRRHEHDDHGLLKRFFMNVLEIKPEILLMENVPALGSDRIYTDSVARLRREGYDVARQIVRYHEYGAASRRKRLFTVGIRRSRVGAAIFFARLATRQRLPRTVGEEIRWLRRVPRDAVPDHDWSNLRSIGHYRHLYRSGKYGWAKLAYDLPAPSFGSVAKTYILHPESGGRGFPERVLSVREVLAIMGFDLSLAFPGGTSRTKRYQMAANAVSPHVSRAAASVAYELLLGRPAQ